MYYDPYVSNDPNDKIFKNTIRENIYAPPSFPDGSTIDSSFRQGRKRKPENRFIVSSPDQVYFKTPQLKEEGLRMIENEFIRLKDENKAGLLNPTQYLGGLMVALDTLNTSYYTDNPNISLTLLPKAKYSKIADKIAEIENRIDLLLANKQNKGGKRRKTKRKSLKKHKKNMKKQIGRGIPEDQGRMLGIPGSETIFEQAKDIIFEDSELPENILNLQELISEDPRVVEYRTQYRGSNDTLLMIAIHKKKFEFARVLIENGADITAVDREGENILEKSIAYKNVDAIKFLIKNRYFEITNEIIDFARAEESAFGTENDANERNDIINKLRLIHNNRQTLNEKAVNKLIEENQILNPDHRNVILDYLRDATIEHRNQTRQQRISNLTMNEILAINDDVFRDLSLTRAERNILYQRLALQVNSTQYQTAEEQQQAHNQLLSLRAKLNISGGKRKSTKKSLKKCRKTRRKQ